MRILITATHRSVVGGTEAYLRALLPLLRAQGHELGLLTARPAGAGRAAVDDLCPGLPSWVADGPAAALAAARAWRPDVVYAQGSPEPAADAALAAAFPAVAYVHDYAGACVSGNKCHAAPVWQPCGRRLGPACLGLYFPRRCGGRNPITALKLYRLGRRRQRLLPRYRAVLVASRHMAAEVVRNGAPPDRVAVTPLFPAATAPDPTGPGPRPRSGRVLFLGRITALKGWRVLTDALPRAAAEIGRPLTLVVAGDGPDEEAFAAAARQRGVPAEFLGWVGAGRREAELRAADVLAVPSVWPEPFGLVGIEAGCVGLPVVAFDVGGIPDWLTPGVSGELAPGERPNAGAFAAALVRALRDDAHLHRLGVGAWETACRFTPESHLARLLPVLEAANRRPCP
jgi:glycosyltransferase involved in cell wall biosynthesis